MIEQLARNRRKDLRFAYIREKGCHIKLGEHFGGGVNVGIRKREEGIQRNGIQNIEDEADELAILPIRKYAAIGTMGIGAVAKFVAGELNSIKRLRAKFQAFDSGVGEEMID